ncbi:hypothetical protein BDF21DRAFT_467676 [Thamnidium elegans]|nr:hypothetical protein BDF21DRAFT_467676 [Thamnidium elegans]
MNTHKNQTSNKNTFREKRKLTEDNTPIAKRKKLGIQENGVSPSITVKRSGKENIIQEQSKEDNQVIIDLSSSEEETEESSEDNSNPLVINYERICLYQNDFSCLKGKEWLKDNIVDLALAELRRKYEKAGQAYLFNSLFFSKLRTIRDSGASKKDYYTTTKRWFKNDELSNKRFWIIPVCDRNHWYVIVVARPRSNRPSITVFDSIKKKTYVSVNLIKAFLKQKYAAEHTGKCRKIEVNIADIPQQKNASDCGLFTIRSANLLLRDDAQHYFTFIKVEFIQLSFDCFMLM